MVVSMVVPVVMVVVVVVIVVVVVVVVVLAAVPSYECQGGEGETRGAHARTSWSASECRSRALSRSPRLTPLSLPYTYLPCLEY